MSLQDMMNAAKQRQNQREVDARQREREAEETRRAESIEAVKTSLQRMIGPEFLALCTFETQVPDPGMDDGIVVMVTVAEFLLRHQPSGRGTLSVDSFGTAWSTGDT